MQCDVDYCVYNRDFICILDKIQINSLCMCEECIIVSIPEEDLKLMKETLLNEFEERYKKDGF